MPKILSCVLLLLSFSGAPAISLADHGSSKTESLSDGGQVKSSAFKRNFFIYRDIGSNVKVEGKKKKRKWWCAWLCKRRVAMKALEINITNQYYVDVEPGPAEVLRLALTRNKTCSDASSCSQREWAVGVSVKANLPNGGDPRPGSAGASLPISGVVGSHSVRLKDGTWVRQAVSKGSHL